MTATRTWTSPARLPHQPPGNSSGTNLAVSRCTLPVILVGSLLAVTDLFIVNVALPTIGRSLQAGPAALELVVAGYNVAYACFLIAGGRLGDQIGRRRLFLGGMAAFVLTSVACGLALNATTLITARVAQGVAAAAMVPQVLATIQALFHGQARVRAIGLFGATIGIAIVFGQVIGGLIVSANVSGLGWRPVFLLNVPIGIIGLLLAYRFVPETRTSSVQNVDPWGIALLTITLGTFLVPVAIGRSNGWPLWCWLCLCATPLAATAFYFQQRRRELRSHVPLMPPSLLRLQGMRRGLLVAFAYFPGAGGFLFTTAVTFQDGLHFSPLETGLTLAPYALSFLAASLVARHLAARLGRWIITAGSMAMAFGLVGFAVQAALGYHGLTGISVAPVLALIGAGNALVMIPMFGIILAHVPIRRAGAASGVLTTIQQAGLGLGAAAMGTILFTMVQSETGSHWVQGTVIVNLIEAVMAVMTAFAALLLGHQADDEGISPQK